MDKKTSLLQKNILITIYLQGEFNDRVSVVELNRDKVNVDYQLEKLQLIKERNGIFESEKIENGLLTQHFRVQSYRLRRSKLACLLFKWQEFNLFRNSKLIIDARFIRKPNDYSSRQVALSNSLKSLDLKGYVILQDIYEDELSKYDKKHAKVISLTTAGIRKAEAILTIKSKDTKTNLIVSK